MERELIERLSTALGIGALTEEELVEYVKTLEKEKRAAVGLLRP